MTSLARHSVLQEVQGMVRVPSMVKVVPTGMNGNNRRENFGQFTHLLRNPEDRQKDGG